MFTIDLDNNIAAHTTTPASTDNLQLFATEKELAKLAADWPASRLVETWNSFAGVAPFDDLKPVKKFTNRKAAVARLWEAIQRLSRDVAPQAERVAPAKGKAKQSPVKAARRGRAQKGRRGATPQPSGRHSMQRSLQASLALLLAMSLLVGASAATVPVRAWKTICPPYPPCCGQVLSSTFRPAWEPLPGTV